MHVHHNIWCNECRTTPLVGARYKHRTKFDYDVCDKCYKQMPNELDSFAHSAMSALQYEAAVFESGSLKRRFLKVGPTESPPADPALWA